MTPETRNKLLKRIERHEGFVDHVYTDTMGKLTCCFGRNLSDVRFSLDEGQYLLSNDVQRAEMEAWRHFPGYTELNEARKTVIVEMIFNIGLEGVLKFKKMIDCLAHQDWKGAAKEMLLSRWHFQTGKRAEELAMIMQSGEI